MSTSLFTLALLISTPGQEGLQKGDELTFAGTVVENSERPSKRLHREYELSLRLFVLEKNELWADAALLTQYKRIEDAVGGLAKPVTGAVPSQNPPPAVRLDFVRIHTDGTVHLLAPVGPPFQLTKETPVQALPAIPLDAFAPSEFGIFPSRMPRSTNVGETWAVASGSKRPDEVWVARKKMDFINAEQCQMLVMNQHSPDWEQPIGGQTSWHRADAVWVSTQDGSARKVLRVILQRDGLTKNPAAWIKVEYELKDHERLSGRAYDRTRRDVEVGYAALAEAVSMVRDAAKLGSRAFESSLGKLDGYMNESAPGTPFREALIAARRTMEAARRGDVPMLPIPPVSIQPIARPHAEWPESGRDAPNIRFGTTQLLDQKGKPVVLIFLKPGGETTDLALAIADALEKRYRGDVLVVPLVVFGDTSIALKDRNRLKLTIPLYDGTVAATAYGVETAPRFAVIDAGGKIKWTFTGVGTETGFLVREQADRLVSPVVSNGLSGTTASPGTVTIPQVPKP